MRALTQEVGLTLLCGQRLTRWQSNRVYNLAQTQHRTGEASTHNVSFKSFLLPDVPQRQFATLKSLCLSHCGGTCDEKQAGDQTCWLALWLAKAFT